MLTSNWQAVPTTTPTLVADYDFEYEVRIRQVSGSGFVWIGDSSVAENDGYRITSAADLVLRVQGDPLYAVAVGETCNVQILAYSV